MGKVSDKMGERRREGKKEISVEFDACGIAQQVRRARTSPSSSRSTKVPLMPCGPTSDFPRWPSRSTCSESGRSSSRRHALLEVQNTPSVPLLFSCRPAQWRAHARFVEWNVESPEARNGHLDAATMK